MGKELRPVQRLERQVRGEGRGKWLLRYTESSLGWWKSSKIDSGAGCRSPWKHKHFSWVNYMVCNLSLSKAVKKWRKPGNLARPHLWVLGDCQLLLGPRVFLFEGWRVDLQPLSLLPPARPIKPGWSNIPGDSRAHEKSSASGNLKWAVIKIVMMYLPYT